MRQILRMILYETLFWIKTNIPNPAFVISPASKEEKLKILLMYNSLRMTLEAQLGIKPKKAQRIGWRKLWLNSIVESLSWPI